MVFITSFPLVALLASVAFASPLQRRAVSIASVPYPHDDIVSVAREATTTWSTYIKGSQNVTGACNVAYGDNSHGACVASSDNCGNYIYAFVPQADGTRKNTIAQVVDVCSSLDATGVYFTLDGFKELGGKPKQSATIENVHWQYVE